jgi:hypothetical protein
MSMANLDDLASKLYAYRDRQKSAEFSGLSEEANLLADALLQAVRKIANLGGRISALETRPRSN